MEQVPGKGNVDDYKQWLFPPLSTPSLRISQPVGESRYDSNVERGVRPKRQTQRSEPLSKQSIP